jgi:hypothetical protein
MLFPPLTYFLRLRSLLSEVHALIVSWPSLFVAGLLPIGLTGTIPLIYPDITYADATGPSS